MVVKKKVGILIDSTQVSKQIHDLVQLSLKSNNYEIIKNKTGHSL